MCRVPSLLKGQWDNEWDGPPQDKDSRRMLKNLKECQMLKMQFTSSRCFKGDVVMHTTPPWAIDGDQGISLCSSMTSWEGTQLDETTSVSKQNSLESLEVTEIGSYTATTDATGYAAHLPRDGGMPP